MKDRSTLSMTAGVVAGLGASACCLLPLVLVMAGLGGSWLATLKALEPFRPIFVAIAVVALFLAWRSIFGRAQACEPGDVCAQPQVLRRRKWMFWGASLLVVGLVTFPYYAVLLF